VLFGDLAAGPLPAHTSIVLVTPAGGGMHALSVDRLLGRQEIVVKPLSGMFDSTRGFSGATILGDGRVMLILDPRSLLATQEALR
jgi:two-component system chemotaxis sensor kinase CheA